LRISGQIKNRAKSQLMKCHFETSFWSRLSICSNHGTSQMATIADSPVITSPFTCSNYV
jgi:hypothetical protein